MHTLCLYHADLGGHDKIRLIILLNGTPTLTRIAYLLRWFGTPQSIKKKVFIVTSIIESIVERYYERCIIYKDGGNLFQIEGLSLYIEMICRSMRAVWTKIAFHTSDYVDQ